MTNIMAERRNLFRVFPHNILFPSLFLAAVNMLGDGLLDLLDPKVRKQIWRDHAALRRSGTRVPFCAISLSRPPPLHIFSRG